MVFPRWIEIKGKKYGPYLYHSVREGNVVHSIYRGVYRGDMQSEKPLSKFGQALVKQFRAETAATRGETPELPSPVPSVAERISEGKITQITPETKLLATLPPRVTTPEELKEYTALMSAKEAQDRQELSELMEKQKSGLSDEEKSHLMFLRDEYPDVVEQARLNWIRQEQERLQKKQDLTADEKERLTSYSDSISLALREEREKLLKKSSLSGGDKARLKDLNAWYAAQPKWSPADAARAEAEAKKALEDTKQVPFLWNEEIYRTLRAGRGAAELAAQRLSDKEDLARINEVLKNDAIVTGSTVMWRENENLPQALKEYPLNPVRFPSRTTRGLVDKTGKRMASGGGAGVNLFPTAIANPQGLSVLRSMEMSQDRDYDLAQIKAAEKAEEKGPKLFNSTVAFMDNFFRQSGDSGAQRVLVIGTGPQDRVSIGAPASQADNPANIPGTWEWAQTQSGVLAMKELGETGAKNKNYRDLIFRYKKGDLQKRIDDFKAMGHVVQKDKDGKVIEGPYKHSTMIALLEEGLAKISSGAKREDLKKWFKAMRPWERDLMYSNATASNREKEAWAEKHFVQRKTLDENGNIRKLYIHETIDPKSGKTVLNYTTNARGGKPALLNITKEYDVILDAISKNNPAPLKKYASNKSLDPIVREDALKALRLVEKANEKDAERDNRASFLRMIGVNPSEVERMVAAPFRQINLKEGGTYIPGGRFISLIEARKELAKVKSKETGRQVDPKNIRKGTARLYQQQQAGIPAIQFGERQWNFDAAAQLLGGIRGRYVSADDVRQYVSDMSRRGKRVTSEQARKELEASPWRYPQNLSVVAPHRDPQSAKFRKFMDAAANRARREQAVLLAGGKDAYEEQFVKLSNALAAVRSDFNGRALVPDPSFVPVGKRRKHPYVPFNKHLFDREILGSATTPGLLTKQRQELEAKLLDKQERGRLFWPGLKDYVDGKLEAAQKAAKEGIVIGWPTTITQAESKLVEENIAKAKAAKKAQNFAIKRGKEAVKQKGFTEMMEGRPRSTIRRIKGMPLPTPDPNLEGYLGSLRIVEGKITDVDVQEYVDLMTSKGVDITPEKARQTLIAASRRQRRHAAPTTPFAETLRTEQTIPKGMPSLALGRILGNQKHRTRGESQEALLKYLRTNKLLKSKKTTKWGVNPTAMVRVDGNLRALFDEDFAEKHVKLATLLGRLDKNINYQAGTLRPTRRKVKNVGKGRASAIWSAQEKARAKRTAEGEAELARKGVKHSMRPGRRHSGKSLPMVRPSGALPFWMARVPEDQPKHEEMLLSLPSLPESVKAALKAHPFKETQESLAERIQAVDKAIASVPDNSWQTQVSKQINRARFRRYAPRKEGERLWAVPKEEEKDIVKRILGARKYSAKPQKSGFMQPLTPNEKLAKIIGSKPLPRTKAIKAFWNYVKTHKLQDGRDIKLDDNLRGVFPGKKKISMFEVMGGLGKNMSGPKVKGKSVKHSANSDRLDSEYANREAAYQGGGRISIADRGGGHFRETIAFGPGFEGTIEGKRAALKRDILGAYDTLDLGASALRKQRLSLAEGTRQRIEASIMRSKQEIKPLPKPPKGWSFKHGGQERTEAQYKRQRLNEVILHHIGEDKVLLADTNKLISRLKKGSDIGERKFSAKPKR